MNEFKALHLTSLWRVILTCY